MKPQKRFFYHKWGRSWSPRIVITINIRTVIWYFAGSTHAPLGKHQYNLIKPWPNWQHKRLFMAVFRHWPHLGKTNTDVIKTLLRAGNCCGKPENIGPDGWGSEPNQIQANVHCWWVLLVLNETYWPGMVLCQSGSQWRDHLLIKSKTKCKNISGKTTNIHRIKGVFNNNNGLLSARCGKRFAIVISDPFHPMFVCSFRSFDNGNNGVSRVSEGALDVSLFERI